MVLGRLVEEAGLAALYRSSRDVKLLCLQRFVRLFAYGISTLVFVAFLGELRVTKTRAGLFMTLTMVGDVAISLLLTLFADGVGRRAVLALGAAMMVASGVVFGLASDYWVLLVAAIFGVISPSGKEIGPFRAVEESIVAQLTPPADRGDIYAWYGLGGMAGTAFGMMASGWLVQHLVETLRWHSLPAYRVVFYVYSGLGVLKLVLVLLLSKEVEAEKDNPKLAAPPSEAAAEETPLLQDAPASEPQRVSWLRSLLPKLNSGSTFVVINLCLLFAMDAFSSGLVTLSWITYFFQSEYGLEEGVLGSVFFASNIVSALSMLVASSLAKRFGNVNTMVFTHLPSAIFLALIPLPHDVRWSLLFLLLRSCTQSMDTPPRSAFLAAILLPSERTAIMGLINIVRSTGQSLGPLITGVLADNRLFWVAFVVAGSLKAVYDLGLLALFKNHEREKVSPPVEGPASGEESA